MDCILGTFMVLHRTKTILFLFSSYFSSEELWNPASPSETLKLSRMILLFFYIIFTFDIFTQQLLSLMCVSSLFSSLTSWQEWQKNKKIWEMKNFYFYFKIHMEICGWTLRRGCLLRKISNIRDNSIYTSLTTVDLDDSQWFEHEQYGH